MILEASRSKADGYLHFAIWETDVERKEEELDIQWNLPISTLSISTTCQ